LEVNLFSYEDGIAVAFLFWIFSVVALFTTLNSKFERNLNKIGQRTSWMTQSPTELTSDDIKRTALSKLLRFTLIYGIGLISILLSWLYVAMFVAQIVYRKSKDSGAPVAIREFRWKLKNTDMSFDQLTKELMKISDLDPENFETFRDQLRSELEAKGVFNG
jgi:hypothetical protein